MFEELNSDSNILQRSIFPVNGFLFFFVKMGIMNVTRAISFEKKVEDFREDFGLKKEDLGFLPEKKDFG